MRSACSAANARTARATAAAAPPSCARSPTISRGAVEVDVLVVLAQLGLRGRREDRLGQAVGLPQPGRQLDAADGALRAGTPSSPSRTGSPAPRTRPGRCRASRPPARGRAPRRARRSRAGGSGRCPAVRSNQNTDRPVRTLPLSGIGVGSTTSYAEMRSEATISRRSPRSYISRTLPRLWRVSPASSAAASGTPAMLTAAASEAAGGAGFARIATRAGRARTRDVRSPRST